MNNDMDASTTASRIRIIAIMLLILMPLAALGTRFELWNFRIGLLLLTVSMLGSLLIQVINAIWLLRKPNRATKSVLRKTSIIALPPLLVIVSVIRGASDGAVIHNISTDTKNPPAFIQAPNERGDNSNPLTYTAEIASIQTRIYPKVTPITSDKTSSEAFTKAMDVAKQLGWQVYESQPEQGHIEAVDTSFWFGFKDDVVIRITSTENGSKIDLRSVSRVGKSDLGANAKRILKFAELFSQ